MSDENNDSKTNSKGKLPREQMTLIIKFRVHTIFIIGERYITT